ALSFGLGLAKPNQVEDTKKLASMLAPHSWGALVRFILFSATAGFVEELIFRGYLQQQIATFSGKMYIGVVASALVFGGGHGYEGIRRMVLIFVFGLMFSALTLWRKNLRSACLATPFLIARRASCSFLSRDQVCSRCIERKFSSPISRAIKNDINFFLDLDFQSLYTIINCGFLLKTAHP